MASPLSRNPLLTSDEGTITLALMNHPQLEHAALRDRRPGGHETDSEFVRLDHYLSASAPGPKLAIGSQIVASRKLIPSTLVRATKDS